MRNAEPLRPPIDQPDPLPADATPGGEVMRLCPWKTAAVLFGVAIVMGGIDAVMTGTFGWPPDRPRNIPFILAVTLPGWLVLVPLVPVVLWLADRFPVGPGRWRRSLLVHVPGCMLFAVVYLALASFLCDFVFAPMTAAPQEMPSTFSDYSRNLQRLLGFYYTPWLGFYWLMLGAHHAFFYLRRALQRDREAADLALRASRLETGLAHANLRALNMQLQPHFLFNTLNAISVLAAKGERVETVRMIGRLSELLRMSLGNTSQTVTLARELEFAQRYLDIEQVRFNDRMSVRFDVAPDTLGAQVPSMILQPLVENAVRHGIARKRASGRIEVRSRRAGDSLELSVRDDGPGFGGAPAADGNGVGLLNTHARLEQLYGPSGFEMYRGNGPGGGALVRVTIPFRTAGDAGPDDVAGVPVIALEAV